MTTATYKYITHDAKGLAYDEPELSVSIDDSAFMSIDAINDTVATINQRGSLDTKLIPFKMSIGLIGFIRDW